MYSKVPLKHIHSTTSTSLCPIQRNRGTEVQCRDRVTETQRYSDTDTEIQRYRDIEIQRYSTEIELQR